MQLAPLARRGSAFLAAAALLAPAPAASAAHHRHHHKHRHHHHKRKHHEPGGGQTLARSLKIDSAAYGNDGLAVEITVGWTASSDALLVYANTGACASTYAAAEQQIEAQENAGFISNELVTGDVSSGAESHGSGTFTASSNLILPGEPPNFTTACAVLYEGQAGLPTDTTTYLTASAAISGG
ncbi:MAG TPA: hypothetical protein VL977_02460 [Solirubrobacteraceae bacterium]|nr:hypothetical protein [Solirubrobacteraceae bacterium]